MQATPEPVLLRQRVEEFLTHCEARNLSPHSVRAYRSDLGTFIALSGVNEITAADIKRKLIRQFAVHLHDSGMKPSSVRRKLVAVRSFCKWLEGEGLLESSLMNAISGPLRQREELPDVPSEDDVRKLLDGEIPTASPERDRLILELLYGSGLRAAELVGINLDDFRDDDVLVVRGKGRKERFVIVGGYAQAAIKAWLPIRAALLSKFKVETPALLFSVGPHRSAERLDVRSVGRILKEVAEGKGLDPAKWHPHLLRHACGTHMHDHDAPLQGVATFLGHARLSTAQIYTRVSVGRMMQTYNKAHPHSGEVRNQKCA
jgi:integrase/recombinase XerC